MSRVGQAPIPIPDGVEVTVDARRVSVTGPRGRLERTVHEAISVERADGELRVVRKDDSRESKALHGLTRSLLANMIQGVTAGFEKALEIQGVGYRATQQGNDIELSVGFSHPVRKAAPPGIELEVPAPTRITVRGIDKELVGQIAAEIRAIKKPEPYKAKGIRYAGEQIHRKAGKAAKGR